MNEREIGEIRRRVRHLFNETDDLRVRDLSGEKTRHRHFVGRTGRRRSDAGASGSTRLQ